MFLSWHSIVCFSPRNCRVTVAHAYHAAYIWAETQSLPITNVGKDNQQARTEARRFNIYR